MAGSLRPPRLLPRLGAAIALLLAATLLPGAVAAQGFFGSFFGQGQPQQAMPFPGQGRYFHPPRPRIINVPRAERRARPAAVPRDDVAVAPKPPPANASRFVVVLGDSLGQLLADGLDEALGDRGDTAVIHKARDSTGLVRDDYFDWPKTVAELLAKPGAAERKPVEAGKPANRERIDVAVMMIGSNDRQSITENGRTFEPDSEAWTAAYTRRVTAIAEAFKARHVPLIWVGVPIAKDDDFADDMAGFNEIYRDVAARTGATYVDTWAAFSNDKGEFSAYGPDVTGQTVRLRAADGVHFTRAGARKLAHFVEGQIRHALDQGEPAPPPLPLATLSPDQPAAKAGEGPAAKPARPEAGPVKALGDMPRAENGRLQTPVAGPRDGAFMETSLTHGAPSHAGRADDATWPR